MEDISSSTGSLKLHFVVRFWATELLVIFFLNSCKMLYWSPLGSLFLFFCHRLGLCRFHQTEKTQFRFSRIITDNVEMQRNSENFHFIVAVSICSVWSILDSVLGTRPSIMAETVPPGCAAYSSLFPFCQCSSLGSVFGGKGSAGQKCRFSSPHCGSWDVLLTVLQHWAVCVLPFPEISCSAPCFPSKPLPTTRGGNGRTWRASAFSALFLWKDKVVISSLEMRIVTLQTHPLMMSLCVCGWGDSPCLLVLIPALSLPSEFFLIKHSL